jgi:hypothetical protein
MQDLSTVLSKSRSSDEEPTLPGEPELRPLPKRKAAEVRRSRASGAGCAVAVLVVLVLVGLLSNALLRALPHPARWTVPTAFVGAGLLWLWLRGRAHDASLRRDLDGGMMAVRRIDVVEAIEMEDPEDLGPAYFLLTREGGTLLLTGQYLEGYKRRGFPWTSFELREGPESHEFFGLRCIGERLVPSLRMRRLTPREEKALGIRGDNYQILPIDFEFLKKATADLLAPNQSPRPASRST